MTDWERLFLRMMNCAAAYSNFCDESGSTRRLERDFEQIEADARALRSSPPVAVQEEGDAKEWIAANAPGGWIDELRKDAGRWRRFVNASEMPFPILALADDPENDCLMVYGRKRLEERVDECDLIPDAYDAMKGDKP